MTITKFTSNSREVLQALPQDLIETKFMSFNKEKGVKALGVFWNPVEDHFGFPNDTMASQSSKKYTKWYILIEISKLFDPLGWLALINVHAKILMQNIWKEIIDWHKQVPEHIKKKWD